MVDLILTYDVTAAWSATVKGSYYRNDVELALDEAGDVGSRESDTYTLYARVDYAPRSDFYGLFAEVQYEKRDSNLDDIYDQSIATLGAVVRY